MRDIVKLQEAMARQGTEIKEYQQAAEESQRKLKNSIEMGYKQSIDVAIATIEMKFKESLWKQELKDRNIREEVLKVANESQTSNTARKLNLATLQTVNEKLKSDLTYISKEFETLVRVPILEKKQAQLLTE